MGVGKDLPAGRERGNRKRSRRVLGRRAAGAGVLGVLAALVSLAFGVAGGHGAPLRTAAAGTDPGCTASAPAPGAVVVCLNESQEGATAAGFGDQSCEGIAGRNPSLDYFLFVLPISADPGRHFAPPAPTVFFDTGTVSGVIAANPMFFYAPAAPGAVLEEAVAHADNGTGTPTGGEAQTFNLTHTCPATAGTPTPTGGTSGTTTGTTTTGTTTTGTTTTGTTTTGTTTTGTTTTGSPTPTPTGGVSGSTTSQGTTSETSSATGGVSGISTTSSNGTGAAAPLTGAGLGIGLAVLLAAGGLVMLAVGRRRGR